MSHAEDAQTLEKEDRMCFALAISASAHGAQNHFLVSIPSRRRSCTRCSRTSWSRRLSSRPAMRHAIVDCIRTVSVSPRRSAAQAAFRRSEGRFSLLCLLGGRGSPAVASALYNTRGSAPVRSGLPPQRYFPFVFPLPFSPGPPVLLAQRRLVHERFRVHLAQRHLGQPQPGHPELDRGGLGAGGFARAFGGGAGEGRGRLRG